MSVPNQKIVKTKKTKPSSDFLLISNHDWIEASKILSPAGFQMYLWLIRHDTNFTNEVSRQAFINDFNSSESTYKRAWKDLKEKGYLQQSKDGSNIYYIYSNLNGIKNDPVTNRVKNDPDNIRVKNEPIIISQEDFIQQGLNPTMIVHEEDNKGNKIVESCGKAYKIIPLKQTSTTQEQIAALGF